MKKEIKNDMYGIVGLIKKIDKDYFIMYDYSKRIYELHNKKESPTFLITLYPKLDKRSLVKVYKSQSKNSMEIFKAIEKTNENIEKYATRYVKDKALTSLKESLQDIRYF